jgi:DNA-binding NtrC family response regulator
VKTELEQIVLQMYRSGIPFSEAIREFERTFLATVLREAKANQVRAAKHLGMHRNTLRRQIHKLELDITTLKPMRRRPPANERFRFELKKRNSNIS